MTSITAPTQRLEGLDLARFLALAGMVVVNFSIVLVNPENPPDLWTHIDQALQGRAAALFVMLAGLGLGLSSKKGTSLSFYTTHYKRAFILLVLGLLNMLIFPADIIHYYAFYFALGVLCVNWPRHRLAFAILLLMALFTLMIMTLDYETEWDWKTYSYEGFWTPTGFIRNLFFNGWHPVIPWLGFFLWGIVLSRLNLRSRRSIILFGGLHFGLFIFFSLFSWWLVTNFVPHEPDAIYLFGASPIPPMPLYILVAGSLAASIIALCLLITPLLKSMGLLDWLARPGRQSLTLYAAHIYLGMGVMEAMGWLETSTAKTAIMASAAFCLLAIFYAWAWSKRYKTGPLEALLRRLSG